MTFDSSAFDESAFEAGIETGGTNVTISISTAQSDFSAPIPLTETIKNITLSILKAESDLLALIPGINGGATIVSSLASADALMNTPMINGGVTIVSGLASSNTLMYAPEIQLGATISPEVTDATLTAPAPTTLISGSISIYPSVATSIYEMLNPDIDTYIDISIATATYTATQPAIHSGITIEIQKAEMQLNAPSPIWTDQGSITIQAKKSTVIFKGGDSKKIWEQDDEIVDPLENAFRYVYRNPFKKNKRL